MDVSLSLSIYIRLIPKRRFSQNHFEHTRKEGSPEKEVRYPHQNENNVFASMFGFLEIAHTNFVSYIRKNSISALDLNLKYKLDSISSAFLSGKRKATIHF